MESAEVAIIEEEAIAEIKYRDTSNTCLPAPELMVTIKRAVYIVNEVLSLLHGSRFVILNRKDFHLLTAWFTLGDFEYISVSKGLSVLG